MPGHVVSIGGADVDESLPRVQGPGPCSHPIGGLGIRRRHGRYGSAPYSNGATWAVATPHSTYQLTRSPNEVFFLDDMCIPFRDRESSSSATTVPGDHPPLDCLLPYQWHCRLSYGLSLAHL